MSSSTLAWESKHSELFPMDMDLEDLRFFCATVDIHILLFQ